MRDCPINVGEFNEKLEQLRRLIDEVISVPTKNDAKVSIRRLDSIVASIKPSLNGYTAGKLEEAVSYAKDAAGMVRNKEHWISNMETSWYVFESDIRNGRAGK